MRRFFIYSLTFGVLLGACSKEDVAPDISTDQSVSPKPKKKLRNKKRQITIPKPYNPNLGPWRSAVDTEVEIQIPKRWRELGDVRLRIFDNKNEQMFCVLSGVAQAPGQNPKSFLKKKVLEFIRKPRFYKVGDWIKSQGKSKVVVRVFDERTIGPYKVVYAEGEGLDRKLRDPRTFSIAAVTDRDGHSLILTGIGHHDTYDKLRETVWTMLKTVR